MSTVDLEVRNLLELKVPQSNGPVTVARQRRTALIYLTICCIGLVPVLSQMSSNWQAAGLGLWMPGAGFVAVG